MLRAVRFRGLLVALSLVGGLCLGEAPRTASGHGDEAVAPALPGVPLSPRLVAQSSDFELVGTARGRTLTIYLDRFADNQPVAAAKRDVEVDGQSMSATAEPNGVYTLTANWVAQAGNHDVVFTILSDQGSDLLAGTLEIPSVPMAANPSGNGGGLRVPSIDNILAFLLGMLATAALQRRSSLAAAARSAADRARSGGSRVVGSAKSRLDDVAASLRRAGSGAKSRFFSIGALRGF